MTQFVFCIVVVIIVMLWAYVMVKISLTGRATTRAIKYVFSQPNALDMSDVWLDTGKIYEWKNIFNPTKWTYSQIFRGLEK